MLRSTNPSSIFLFSSVFPDLTSVRGSFCQDQSALLRVNHFPIPAFIATFGPSVSSLLSLKNIFLSYSDDFNALASKVMAI